MDGQMRALIKDRKGRGARLEQVAIPTIASDEVLIRVNTVSICGTDVHIYNWDEWAASRVKPPYIFGHEFSGVIVETGEQVTSIQNGDRVTAETHIVCGTCAACRRCDYHVCFHTQIIGVDRDGCFADYIAMPARNVWKLDGTIPFNYGSVMEPMGNAVHTVFSDSIVGKTVAVVGCGPIGLMAVAVCNAAGARNVVALDVNPYRLQLAEELGATHMINSSQEDPIHIIESITSNNGADVVLEMSGHPVAIQQALQMLTPGGRISLLGLPTRSVDIDLTNWVVFKGITIYGISGRRMYETWQQVSGLLISGKIKLDKLITHQLPFAEYEKGFSLMNNGQCGKVIMTMDE